MAMLVLKLGLTVYDTSELLCPLPICQCSLSMALTVECNGSRSDDWLLFTLAAQ